MVKSEQTLGPVFSTGGGRLPDIPPSFGLSPQTLGNIKRRFKAERIFYFRVKAQALLPDFEKDIANSYGQAKGFVFVVSIDTSPENLAKTIARLIGTKVLWVQHYDTPSVAHSVRVVFGIHQ
jgi:hypothetical protein